MAAPTKRPQYHNYNCHMAVLQWAMLANGSTTEQALRDVERITRYACPHCKGVNSLKASLQNDAYGTMFCGQAVPLVNINASPGDVVIIPNHRRPTHSMVVVQVNAGQVFVRGYNNEGTFVGAIRDEYDDTSRNLAGRKRPEECPVFRIPEMTFLAKVRQVSRMMRMKPFD